jgi:hypothetical protein
VRVDRKQRDGRSGLQALDDFDERNSILSDHESFDAPSGASLPA